MNHHHDDTPETPECNPGAFGETIKQQAIVQIGEKITSAITTIIAVLPEDPRKLEVLQKLREVQRTCMEICQEWNN